MSNIKIKPLHDYVFIEAKASENITASGIIILDSAKEKSQKGKVLAFGNGIENKKINVSINDNVLYGKY